MSLRDRWRLGVNWFTVLKAAKELSSDPNFEPTTQREFAEAILCHLSGMNRPQAVKDGIDWDSLIEFIERILPLILEIIMLFL